MARFFKIGLIVTGKGEEAFLPVLLRSLTAAGNCHFRVLRRVGQRSPRLAARAPLHVIGRPKSRVPTRDEDEIGLPAWRHLASDEGALVLVVDDLEHARRGMRGAVFRRYREALDASLGPHYTRAGVYFLVNMLEAYYFADARALRTVLGLAIVDHAGDVEDIRHPKNLLKELVPGFDEIRAGAEIVASLDLEHVLRDPSTCAALRALFAWCVRKTGQSSSGFGGARFCLNKGNLDEVTRHQSSNEHRSLVGREAQ